MNKKKLLVITSTFPRWKDDTDPPFVFELSRRLMDSFDVNVLAPGYPGALAYEIMDGITIYRFRYMFKNLEKLAGSEGILPTLKRNPFNYLLVPFFLLGEFLAVLKLSRKIKPDVIHAHWILPQGLIAALAKKFTGIPFVLTTHGGDIYGLQGGFASLLKGFALRNAETVTVVSNDIKDTIKYTFGKNIHTDVISMGVDSALFNPDKRSPQILELHGIKGPFLLFVGRLTEKKGVQFLIEAMPKVTEQYPDAKLLVIGSGEQEQSLTHLAQNLGISESVIFHGGVPNSELPAYFATADIFIGPSVTASGGDTEGFGLTFVEAGMSGCFVIGTDVGGIGDIIENGKTGFLVPEKNPEILAETIKMILDRKESLAHIKKKTRNNLCERYDWSAIAQKYIEILAIK
jgi:glycosyltransferase involved in cell wall biosynthesis